MQKQEKVAMPRQPQLGKRLERADLSVLGGLDPEEPARGLQFTGDGTGLDLWGRELEGCLLEGVRLAGADLGRWGLTDVALCRCDLSGADLTEARMVRVRLEDCRLEGVQLGEAFLLDTTFQGCRMDYAQLSRGRMKRVLFSRCNLAGAALQQMRHTGWRLEECDLRRAELFGTPLEGLDLTTDQLEGIVVRIQDLAGARVTALQAAGLAKLMGLVVE